MLSPSPYSPLPIPPELTEHTLAFLAPQSVAAFAQTCRAAHALVYAAGDQFLWRQLFLARFDDPRRAVPPPVFPSDPDSTSASATASGGYDWKAALQARVAAELRPDPAVFLQALREAPPVRTEYYAEPSLNTRWVTETLQKQREREGYVLDSPSLRYNQDVMQLRAYLALAFELDQKDKLERRTREDLGPGPAMLFTVVPGHGRDSEGEEESEEESEEECEGEEEEGNMDIEDGDILGGQEVEGDGGIRGGEEVEDGNVEGGDNEGPQHNAGGTVRVWHLDANPGNHHDDNDDGDNDDDAVPVPIPIYQPGENDNGAGGIDWAAIQNQVAQGPGVVDITNLNLNWDEIEGGEVTSAFTIFMPPPPGAFAEHAASTSRTITVTAGSSSSAESAAQATEIEETRQRFVLAQRLRRALRAVRVRARCFVYDLRHYTAENNYGPFNADGSVNWIHVEAMITVIALNLRDLPDLWRANRPPTGFDAARAYSAPGTAHLAPAPASLVLSGTAVDDGVGAGEVEGKSRDKGKGKQSWEFDSASGGGEASGGGGLVLGARGGARDWAGVGGRWKRFVCFMDYRDLYAFNYSTTMSGPRDPGFFEDSQFMEATRQIVMQLSVDLDWDPDSLGEVYPIGYPPIKFSGVSAGSNGNEATVNGYVRMAKDGAVRWSWLHKSSNVNGQAQWSSEGVQLGGVCSAMGVIGAWGASHENGDPAGPFWMWRVGDDDARLDSPDEE
ncbi:hypothetical protein PUNSTDRAFT_123480 [Punctularia strigosozonata HHB-11173 SS5]|uniref:uncharacterized protein n=1 Tax=Punctularia strigosozonata (strain HHB-11173) TaxID=741275 RepID=UPI0004417A57|nr:uncharacterized protein PUNSTDRAFT_123480 [Punctularia strigosozonata HHB-11173 SS5]EIN13464.1 hypothetical protein PUNSTDRAFT_123480 [Punctularia strigosozonata HHB-11173 SS5]